jgi:hypothetical protein
MDEAPEAIQSWHPLRFSPRENATRTAARHQMDYALPHLQTKDAFSGVLKTGKKFTLNSDCGLESVTIPQANHTMVCR